MADRHEPGGRRAARTSPAHGHGHGHDHAAGAGRTRLAIAFGITASILIAELIGAAITGSLALLVDAAHMLVDAGGLLVALVASLLSTRPRSSRRTWGWQRAEILAAGLQAAVLLAVGVYAIVEGIRRLIDPPPADDVDVVLLAVIGAVGLAANIASLLVLSGGRGQSLNMRAAFLEVLNDALGSVAVIAAAAAIRFTGWTGADALAGLLIAVLILPRALLLLRESGSVLLESAPRGLDVAEVAEHLETVPHVVAVHDLHASLVATGVPVLTAHVVVEDECFHDGSLPSVLDALQLCAVEHFPVAVQHTTFQLEPASHRRHESLGHGHD
ncbi:cation diffusion facilitator family transporter [Kocuria palustris]|uniref:cation diffusion facilitator family transporter n=1 Tax=Kocuria palustris TaxID=71999 RepID=UPI0011A1FF9B|nr:cation diffusion facilitator family transporter [Kocuria palustris]